MWIQSLSWEDTWEEGMATPPGFLPGESPWTEVPGRLQSMGLQRVRHDWATKHSTAQCIVHGLPVGTSGKESACQFRRCKSCRFNLWVGKIPWRKTWQPTLVFLPGTSHGQRSLAVYGPKGHKESDRTEVTYMYTAWSTAVEKSSIMTDIWPLNTGLAKYRHTNINKGDLEEFDWKKKKFNCS